MEKLIILGCGGFAREAYHWVEGTYQVIMFYEEQKKSEYLFRVPVCDNLHPYYGSHFLVAVGDPKVRERLWDAAIKAGLRPCLPIIHSTAIVAPGSEIGAGSILCPHVVVTDQVDIGKGTILNLSSTVGHDCELLDFVTVSPGVNISGNVFINSRTTLGTNACIREKVSIGRDAVVGMGAVVLKDIPDGETWVGNPAQKRVVRPQNPA